MVTASQYTLNGVGMSSGRSYSVSGYISDVTQTYTKMTQSGLAGTGSPDNFVTPERIVINRLSVTTGPTVIKVLMPEVNGNTVGSVWDIVAFVSTAANPPQIQLLLEKGSTIRIKEI